ncbi:DUF4267 domain-containing protein [Nannocystis radixulma]|uniref:DUF4267 domain-containing protein n=1 Tax=Nannocystis radixulma TaxID=2995305 RepID=A0ABT5BJP8_9BACT|nr:DUF4267 domain-containing protein [Nannocystis radixulma]MDC0673237.1 DUF4267 domain-containing protein [Nannocystis radixulma]
MELPTFLTVLALGRFAIGLAPIVAPVHASRLLGFPSEHDNPTSRLMARLFGVRDIGLGAIVLADLADPAALRRALWLNLAMDLGDALMIAIPLVRRQGIVRAAALSLAFALGGAAAWTVALAWQAG